MTACLYISPDMYFGTGRPVPAFISDTLATIPGSTIPVFLPSDIEWSADLPLEPVTLTRKTFSIGGRIAMAAAGNGAQIEEFVNEVAYQIGAITLAEDPMSYVAAIANDFREIEIFGASPLDYSFMSPIDLRNNLKPKVYNLPSLGAVNAIGSGAWDVMQHAQDYDSWLGNFPPNEKPANTLISSFSVHLNLKTWEPDPMQTRDWGGFFETLSYDFSGGCWVRGRSCSYHLSPAIEIERNVVTIPPGALSLLYNPGTTHGSLLSARITEKGPSVFGWLLKDITAKGELDPVAIMNEWHQWKPTYIVLVFIFRVPNGTTDLVRTIEQVDLGCVRVLFDENGFRMSFAHDYFDRLATRICNDRGLRYVPYRYVGRP